jgi:hypothetical protein
MVKQYLILDIVLRRKKREEAEEIDNNRFE